jgi:hypothetical protein
MSESPWERRRWALRVVCIALSAFVLVTAPFAHEISCHLHDPLHCTACASSHIGSTPELPAMPGLWALTDAGSAVTIAPSLTRIGFVVPSIGRSPPARSL